MGGKGTEVKIKLKGFKPWQRQTNIVCLSCRDSEPCLIAFRDLWENSRYPHNSELQKSKPFAGRTAPVRADEGWRMGGSCADAPARGTEHSFLIHLEIVTERLGAPLLVSNSFR